MRKLRYILYMLIALVTGVIVSACNSADTREQYQVQNQQNQYLNTQPPPFFDYSLERYEMTELYKARNNAVATWTYRQSEYTGEILFSCPSVGFPIPGGTQLTNPERYNTNGANLPQAEPNGLFSPPTAEGTWVMCLDPSGKAFPVFVEPHVITSPVPLQLVGHTLTPVTDKKPSILIETKPAPSATPGR